MFKSSTTDTQFSCQLLGNCDTTFLRSSEHKGAFPEAFAISCRSLYRHTDRCLWDVVTGEPESISAPQWDASPHLHQVLGPDSPVHPIETELSFLPGLDEACHGEFFQNVGGDTA